MKKLEYWVGPFTVYLSLPMFYVRLGRLFLWAEPRVADWAVHLPGYHGIRVGSVSVGYHAAVTA